MSRRTVRKEKRDELVYGFHAIYELLRAKRRRLAVIYTTKPHPKVWRHIALLLPRGMQVQYVDKTTLTKLAGTPDHQLVVAYTQPLPIRKKFFSADTHPFLLMLDGIQDPRNLGAILRSAYCTGVSGVIVCAKGSSLLTPTVFKASAGLAEHLEIFISPSVGHALQQLKTEKYQVYAAMISKKAQPAQAIAYTHPVCIVIGSEDKGVSAEVAKESTQIMLPQKEAEISYNASVAAGILLFLVGLQVKTIQ